MVAIIFVFGWKQQETLKIPSDAPDYIARVLCE